ncbi:MAG TPA: hypothetical protein DCE71_04340 [Parachlamydiales bacterium]|nr:hypothetical protein [Parachlamydiales bacterium]
MSFLPSLQELCLTKVLQSGLAFVDDEVNPEVQAIAERIVSGINPVQRLQKDTNWISEYQEVVKSATKAVKADRFLANRSLSWISLQPSFNTLKNKLFWELKRKKIPFDWELEMTRIIDFPQLFDLLMRHTPLQVRVRNGPILQAEDVCLLFVARHNYWAGIAYAIEQGANPSIEFSRRPDDPSRNLLHWSIHKNGFNLMTIALICSGININLEDYDGKSPLELLAGKVPLIAKPGYDLKSALQLLIYRGADLHSYGQKALDQVKMNRIPCLQEDFHAKEKNRQEVIAMLENTMECRQILYDPRIA